MPPGRDGIDLARLSNDPRARKKGRAYAGCTQGGRYIGRAGGGGKRPRLAYEAFEISRPRWVHSIHGWRAERLRCHHFPNVPAVRLSGSDFRRMW